LRLVPRDETRVYLGLALCQEGDAASEMYLLRQVIDGRPSAVVRSISLQNTGYLAFVQGRLEDALVAFDEATCAMEGAGVSAANHFAVAFRLGRRDLAKEAAERLESIDDEKAVDAFLSWSRAQELGSGGIPIPSPSVEDRKWAERLPAHALRIAHEIG